jgi:hypothetical protein
MPSTRFYIPKSKHGIVIGKGASTLKELQTKYNVQIRMPNRDDTSCAVEIMAQSDDSIARLKHALEQLLGFTVSTVPLVSATLNVPSNKHGAIIGKGGKCVQCVCVFSFLHSLSHKQKEKLTVTKRDFRLRMFFPIVFLLLFLHKHTHLLLFD